MAMAAGEYVSVHSQADTEKADLNRERVELAADSVGEHAELAAIYVGRGVDPVLATQVANSLWRMTPSAPTRAMNWVFPTNCAHGQLKLRWPPLPASASGQRCHFL
jgi:VIT1/CCC1 family predicted Fe2+/Mn2+ transporter